VARKGFFIWFYVIFPFLRSSRRHAGGKSKYFYNSEFGFWVWVWVPRPKPKPKPKCKKNRKDQEMKYIFLLLMKKKTIDPWL
jgi:hypothetical protein